MRIAYVTDSFAYNDQKIFRIYKSYLSNAITMHVFSNREQSVKDSAEEDVRFSNRDFEYLVDLINDYNPDIVHLSRSSSFEGFVSKLRNLNCRFKVETLHFDIWDKYSLDFDFHVVVSDFLLLDIVRRRNLSPSHLNSMVLNPPPVDIDAVSSASDKVAQNIRREFAPNNELLIGMGSTAHPLKKSSILLTALKALKKKVPNFKFLSIGGMPDEFKLRLQGSELLGNVVDVDWVGGDAYYCYLKALDIYTHHSLVGETFGLSIAEAMAAGLPVVVNSTPWDVNAQAELVDNSVDGFVAQSPEGWADAIALLAEDPLARLQMGMKGRQKVAGRFHPALVTSELEAFYQSVTGGQKVEVAGVEVIRETAQLFEKRKKDIYDRAPGYLIGRAKSHFLSRLEVASSYSAALKGLAAKYLHAS